jgi:hypothetical protein
MELSMPRLQSRRDQLVGLLEARNAPRAHRRLQNRAAFPPQNAKQTIELKPTRSPAWVPPSPADLARAHLE